METRAAAVLALVGSTGVCMAAALLRGQHLRRRPEQVEPEPEANAAVAAARERERWLWTIGVQWVDGRAPARCGAQTDIVDLAVELANFASEVGHEANGQGGCVDRKPHKQRMSADFGGPMHDGGPNTRLGGKNTQAMLTGEGPGARGLRRRWELLDAAVNDTCADTQLIQMFAVVATGQGPGATTGEPHADAQRDRQTNQPIGARGTIHLTAGTCAEREFRVAEIRLQKKSSGDSSLRICDSSLDPLPGADGRRHLPADLSVSRRYRNHDVSILNAEGLGVVRGTDSARTQTGHEGGLAPLGGSPPAGQCTMHGGVVFSLSKAPSSDELRALAVRVASDASAIGPGLRHTNLARWESICSDNGAALIASIDPRRRRPQRVNTPGGAAFSIPSELVGIALGYNSQRYIGKAVSYDPDWPVDCEARESYGSDSVEGQLFLALDRVRSGAGGGVADGAASFSHAQAGRTPVYSRAARTDRNVDALCNVLSVPLESVLLGDGTPQGLASLVASLNKALPSDIRAFQVFRTSKGFNAKQFCEYRQYEMLVPMSALRPDPGPPGSPGLQSQRCVWRAGVSESPSHSGCWERRECGLLGLLSTPVEIRIPAASECWFFEWTQSRRQFGSLPPMIRLAVCVQVPNDMDAESQGKSSETVLEQGKEQWFVSAVGERKAHAYGAALEYFSCTAVGSSDPSRPEKACHELRTASLADMFWRPLELHTLHILKQPAKPQKLPFVELKTDQMQDKIGRYVVLRRLGFWCDGHEPPAEDHEKQETCTAGSQLHKPSVERLSGSALAAAREATLRELLTPAELAEVQALAAGVGGAVDDSETSPGGDPNTVLLDPEVRPGGKSLAKKDRTRLYDSINSLDQSLRCTLIDEDGQARVIKVWRDNQAAEVASGPHLCAAADNDKKQQASSAACAVLDAVEFGMMQLVQLEDDTDCTGCADFTAPGGQAEQDAKLLDSVVAIQASGTAKRLNTLLQLFEGKGGHSFHNFSASLTASQRKCHRQVSRAMCSGSFLIGQPEVEGTRSDPIANCWAILTVCSPGFLYRQIQHMIGCIVAVACGAVPTEHLLYALRGGSGNSVGGGGGGEILRTPCAPLGTLSLVSCCYCRKLPRKDTKPIWVGPRAGASGGGLRQGFCGSDRAALLDWRAKLHDAQMSRYRAGTSGKGTVDAWCGELRAAAKEMWNEAATQERLANRVLQYPPVGIPAVGSSVSGTTQTMDRVTFDAYERVLHLLRAIESNGEWPETSLARTSLYAGETGAARRGHKPKKESETQDGETQDKNPVRQQTFCMGAMPADREPPAANRQFADLMRALAELEHQVLPYRTPSSTVAVNKHVTYRPHKDGGAGAGQGVSLIIGLGDYSGGELVVEGKVHDVRYNPLEFNGWTERHWTLPFRGERFSIVWFTPRGCEGQTLWELASPVQPRPRSSE